jgi:predicted nuclease of predicted toxin-antitoxin system
LFDQNVSARLVSLLADIFPGSAHVRLLELRQADDTAIWDHAAKHEFIVVSKDADAPPKVIWLRLGNCPTSEVEAVLRARARDIEVFVQDPDAAVLVLE